VIFNIIRKNINKILGLVVLFYPVFVFFSIRMHLDPGFMLIVIMIFGMVYLGVILLNQGRKKTPAMFISPCILILIGIVGIVLETPFVAKIIPQMQGNRELIIKLYPVLASFSYTIIFLTTIIYPPTLAYGVAQIIDSSIKNSAAEKPMEIFCKKASIVWCVFFFLDMILAIATLFIYPNDSKKATDVWTLYNGLVTYLIIAIIFIIQVVQGKMIIRKYAPKPKKTQKTQKTHKEEPE